MSDRRLAAEWAPSGTDETSEPLDGAAALALVGGNETLLGELATLFLDDCPRWLEEMAAGIRREDPRGLHFAAHSLRGAVSWFGASAASGPARELEAAARAGDLEAATHAYSALETALRRLTPALTALAGRPRTPPSTPDGKTP